MLIFTFLKLVFHKFSGVLGFAKCLDYPVKFDSYVPSKLAHPATILMNE